MRVFALTLLTASALLGHPMGNFSVSHYARLEVSPVVSHLVYVLDLAEIPTFELLQKWKVSGRDPVEIETKARVQVREWLTGLTITADGSPVHCQVRRVATQVTDGAGGLPVLRVEVQVDLDLKPGLLQYDDSNYAGRAGWKEIVINSGEGATVSQATHTAADLSRALTAYPSDPTVAPPQDLRASLIWATTAKQFETSVTARQKKSVPENVATVPAPIRPEPASVVNTSPREQKSFSSQQPAPPGTVVRGDFLSQLLSNRHLSWSMMAFGLIAALGLGAMHALSPGHGKTIVAAYLVGTRGTFHHAIFLGAMVTFTHTISVFALGLGVLFFQQHVVPERIIPVLGALSGLSIVCIGAWLLYQRIRALAFADAYRHGHMHHHNHVHHHHHEHPHSHDYGHGFVHTHTHGGITHSHVMPHSRPSLGSLITLGASGGLVPCPSALILMLSAIGVGRTAFGLGLLVSFSAGLALVLMAIGMVVIYAKHLLPETDSVSRHPVLRLVPVFSAVAVMILGTLMALTSVGWIRPIAFLS